MKKVKFADPLPNLVLDSSKNTTWRINDSKNITADDILSLCHNDENEFAKAKVISVRETTFGELTSHDKEGHEKFSGDEEMYKTYSGYYNIQVTPKTKLKVIKFKLI